MPHLVRPDGCRLYVEVHGPDAGSPVLLLEGIGGSIPGWRATLEGLAARHRTIAFDLPGNGRSDGPEEALTMSRLAADALAVLDLVGAGAAHLYGQSLGGMVALEIALTEPGRVRSLVLGATHGGHERAHHRLAWKAPKSKPFVTLYGPDFVREHPDRVAEDLRAAQRQPQAAGMQRRQWEAVSAWDAWDRLPEIRVPVLVLHGSHDRLVPVENGRRLAGLIPGARLHVLEGAGHVYHWERPGESVEAVLAFLAEVDAGAG